MKTPKYGTGDPGVDAEIDALLERADTGRPEDSGLIKELVVSALRLGRERYTRGDVKIANSALKEMRYSFQVFGPFRQTPKVSIFGSARTAPDHPDYILAREFAAAMAAQGWMSITGAGPGIMTAGIEGAGPDNSFGVNILLPFEPAASHSIANDPKLINYRYFFTRKLAFMKESHGFALFPGGFGTMDEGFELLTLMQTGKALLAPVVMMDAPASTYWERWRAFIVDEFLENGLISPEDMNLMRFTSSIEEAVHEICTFYATYHSSRYVHRDLVIRTHRRIGDDELVALNDEFSDIVESGRIDRAEAHRHEIEDDEALDKERLSFRFDRHHFARLRQLIDALNAGTPTLN